jgi:hypothetical protein
MSATAGISAAKRRRGVSQAPLPSNNSSTNTQSNIPPQPVQLTPIKILENHEIRLRRVEPRLENAFEGFEAHEKRLEQVENVLTQLIDQTSKSSDSTPLNKLDNVVNEDVTRRLQKLESSLLELQVLITKVQTFAMETNTNLLRLSRETNNVTDKTPTFTRANILDFISNKLQDNVADNGEDNGDDNGTDNEHEDNNYEAVQLNIS